MDAEVLLLGGDSPDAGRSAGVQVDAMEPSGENVSIPATKQVVDMDSHKNIGDDSVKDEAGILSTEAGSELQSETKIRTWLEAAEIVLREESPLHIKDMFQRIVDRNLVASQSRVSLETLMYKETLKSSRRFRRVEGRNGMFALSKVGDDEMDASGRQGDGLGGSSNTGGAARAKETNNDSLPKKKVSSTAEQQRMRRVCGGARRRIEEAIFVNSGLGDELKMVHDAIRVLEREKELLYQRVRQHDALFVLDDAFVAGDVRRPHAHAKSARAGGSGGSGIAAWPQSQLTSLPPAPAARRSGHDRRALPRVDSGTVGFDDYDNRVRINTHNGSNDIARVNYNNNNNNNNNLNGDNINGEEAIRPLAKRRRVSSKASSRRGDGAADLALSGASQRISPNPDAFSVPIMPVGGVPLLPLDDSDEEPLAKRVRRSKSGRDASAPTAPDAGGTLRGASVEGPTAASGERGVVRGASGEARGKRKTEGARDTFAIGNDVRGPATQGNESALPVAVVESPSVEKAQGRGSARGKRKRFSDAPSSQNNDADKRDPGEVTPDIDESRGNAKRVGRARRSSGRSSHLGDPTAAAVSDAIDPPLVASVDSPTAPGKRVEAHAPVAAVQSPIEGDGSARSPRSRRSPARRLQPGVAKRGARRGKGKEDLGDGDAGDAGAEIVEGPAPVGDDVSGGPGGRRTASRAHAQPVVTAEADEPTDDEVLVIKAD